MQPGLYEQLLTIAVQRDLDLLDPRLYSLAPIDSQDAHNVIAQYLEHLLANSLAAFRGEDAAERQEATGRSNH